MLYFEHPIQTIPAIGQHFSISRHTLSQAALRGAFATDAYKSATIWLIDTQGPYFLQWLEDHWKHHLVLAKQPPPSP